MHGENPEYGPPRPATGAHPHPPTGYAATGPRFVTPRRKSNRTLIIVLVIIGLLCVSASVALALSSVIAAPPKTPQEVWDTEANQSGNTKLPPVLVMMVNGTGTADITYNINGTGGQELDAKLPWSRDFGPHSKTILLFSLVAQDKTGVPTATLNAKISFAGKDYPCEASGAYAVAMCSGSSNS